MPPTSFCKPNRPSLILLGALIALSSAFARADQWGDWMRGMAGLEPKAALARLNAAPEAYKHRADYYYWLGVYTRQSGGSSPQILEYFEQALMLDPDHAGAWYDYGLALCQAGQQASCQAVLDSARARFGPPPALRQWQDQTAIQIAGEVRSQIGRSSNLNAGSQSRYVDLWLDGERVPLLLADSSRAQPAIYSDAGIDIKLAPTQNPAITATLTAYERRPLENRDMHGNYRVLAGEFGYQLTGNQRIGLQSYRMEDTRLGALNATGAWWQMLHGTQGTRTLLALEQRNPSGGVSSYASLRTEAATKLWRSVEGRIGIERDESDAKRPGRSQQRHIGGLRLPLQIMGKGELELAGRWMGAHDSAAFSPFLGDVRRKIKVWETRLDLSWPLTAQIDLRAQARYTRQRSNLALFDYRERQAALGLAFKF